MKRIVRVSQAAPLILALLPVVPGAAFGMGMGGGGVGGTPSVGVATPMGSSGAGITANGGNAAFAHGSPAGSSNPAVGMIEARQRDAQVSAEVDQARKAAKSIGAAPLELRRGEEALVSGQADQAMQHFDHAEAAIGIHASSTEMGVYSKSTFGSVAAGGVELSVAVVH